MSRIISFNGKAPRIDPTAFIAPTATLIGDVVVGPEASVWFGAVLRADHPVHGIRIGARTSVQDNCVLHTTIEHPTVVGDRCVIGHIVHLEGCTIEDDALVGNGAIVLHRAIVRSGAIVAANSVVLNDTEVPSGAIAVGSPATIREGRARRELIDDGVAAYLARSRRFRNELRRID